MTQGGRPRQGRSRAAAEIAFVILCVVVAEWVVIPIFGRNKKIGMIPIAIVILFGCLSHRTRHESARDIGFSRHNFLRAFRLLIYWMIPGAAAVVAIGWTLGSLHFGRPRSWGTFALGQFWLFLWGLMQQYALQAIVNRRLQEILGRGGPSILAAALVFAVLHLPNLWLAVATLVGGILWSAIYQRAPNLYALALSHCIMTSVLASSISSTVLHGLRVGYNYF